VPPLQLAVCAQFRDEAPYLREWVEFHRRRGVERFVLYDCDSRDGGATVLAREVRSGLVRLVPWPGSYEDAATSAYDDCRRRFGADFRWLAFLAIEEFLFAPGGRDLPSVLADYAAHPGVFVQWQVFGSSGLDEASGQPVTRRYLKRAPEQWVRNRRGRTIVDPSRTVRIANPHFAEFAGGVPAVNEAGVPVCFSLRTRSGGWRLAHLAQRARNLLLRHVVEIWPRAPVDPYLSSPSSLRRVSVARLRIHHYAIRGVARFAARMAWQREPGGPWTSLDSTRRSGRFRYHDRNDVFDDALADGDSESFC